jgi:GNAT superfamily N-acetyltransferase
MYKIYLSMQKDLTQPIPEPIFRKEYIMVNATENCRRLWEEVMDVCFGGYQPGSFRYVCVNNAYYGDDRNYILLNENNELIGSSNSWQHSQYEGYVANICVMPSYRGKGLAAVLVNYGLREMQKRGMKWTFIGVGIDNYPAIKTYLNCGFIPMPKKAEEIGHWADVFRAMNLPIPDYDKTIKPKDEPHPPRPWPYQLAREKAARVNGDLFIHGEWNRFNMYVTDKTEVDKLRTLTSLGENAQRWLREVIADEKGRIYADCDVNPRALLFVRGDGECCQFGTSKDGCFEEGQVLFFEERRG